MRERLLPVRKERKLLIIEAKKKRRLNGNKTRQTRGNWYNNL